MTYEDDLHETEYYNWMEWQQTTLNKRYKTNTTPNLFYKEGRQIYSDNTWVQYIPPTFGWTMPLYRTHSEKTFSNDYRKTSQGMMPTGYIPGGIMWDPFNRAERIRELRPGKNACKYEWNLPPQIPINSDLFQYTGPYTTPGPYQGNQRPGCFQQTHQLDPDELCSRNEAQQPLNDYTFPDYFNQPIVQTGRIWNALHASVVEDPQFMLRKPNKAFPGLLDEKCLKGIPQIFAKIVPIFRADQSGNNPTLLECTAQLSVRTSITFKITSSDTAIFARIKGPWSWTNQYSHLTRDYTFRQNAIRPKAGGFKRTWQNIEYHTASTHNDIFGEGNAHPREDPFKESVTVTSGGGSQGTYSLTNTQPKIHQDTRTTQTTTTAKTRWYTKLRSDLKLCAGKEGHVNEAYEQDPSDPEEQEDAM